MAKGNATPELAILLQPIRLQPPSRKSSAALYGPIHASQLQLAGGNIQQQPPSRKTSMVFSPGQGLQPPTSSHQQLHLPHVPESRKTSIASRYAQPSSSLLPVVRIEFGQARVTRFHPEALTRKFFKRHPPRRGKPEHLSDTQLHRMRRASDPSPSSPLDVSYMYVPYSQSPPQPSSPFSSTDRIPSPSSVATDDQFSVWRDDLCQLCAPTAANQHGETIGYDEPPAPTRRLPCFCEDHQLHMSCLESKFLEEAVYPDAWSVKQQRRLYLRCTGCGEVFAITRRRGRRPCDGNRRTSFVRHLLTVLALAGALLGFGLWSLLRGGRLNIVNGILIGSGAMVALIFIAYEVWHLHRSFDYHFIKMSRMGYFSKLREQREAADVESDFDGDHEDDEPEEEVDDGFGDFGGDEIREERSSRDDRNLNRQNYLPMVRLTGER